MNKNLLCLVAISVLLLLSSCAKGPKDVLEKAENATFIIYTFDEHGAPAGTGSGFFIDKEGIGITNYHVLDNSMKAVIKMKNGDEYEIDEILASDKKWDIVKFSIVNDENISFDYLNFSNETPEQGEKVYNLSAPLGLEQTFADGLISSIRNDSHGDIIQVSVPISPGSSGSPIMNEDGDVVAVATFKASAGENLNFGVVINDDKLSMMTSNPFTKSNKQFKNKNNFVILNVPSDEGNTLTLNALQFKDDATIAYMSYTNLDMSMNGTVIWCKVNKQDEGFYIEDNDTGKRYYMQSSDLGTSQEDGTSVPLATVRKFKVYFPSISNRIENISISEGGNPYWSFSDINLEDYRTSVNVDFSKYHKEYAYSTMHEGQLEQAETIFEDILEEDPENFEALNALGIISYSIDNNQDAIKYFSNVIKYHPNSIIGYLNRSCVYKYQNENDKAINDITGAIRIDNNNPSLFVARAELYYENSDWGNALQDIDTAIEKSSVEKPINYCNIYYLRGLCQAQQDDLDNAKRSLLVAMELAPDDETKKVISTTLVKISPDLNNDSRYASDSASSYFKGSIGSFPITLFLEVSSNREVQGWYYYDSKGPAQKLILAGVVGESGQIIMTEYDENGVKTGIFSGYYSDGVYQGKFDAIGTSTTYDFYLTEL